MDHDIPDHQQPITGFALYGDGSLLLKRGHGCRALLPVDPTDLSGDDFKALLWALESALGLRYNELQVAEPSSIQIVLKVVAHCHANRPRDLLTEAVLTFARPAPIYLDFPPEPEADEPSGGGVREPVAGLVSRPAVCSRAHAARVERMGGVSEARGLAVA